MCKEVLLVAFVFSLTLMSVCMFNSRLHAWVPTVVSMFVVWMSHLNDQEQNLTATKF